MMLDNLYLDELLMLQQQADEEKDRAEALLNKAKTALQSSKLHFAKYVELSAEVRRFQKEH